MKDYVCCGKYVSGDGVARKICESKERTRDSLAVFCKPMIGTFNVEIHKRDFFKIVDSVKPSRVGGWLVGTEHLPVLYYLVTIQNEKAEAPCWAVHWRDRERNTSKIDTIRFELISDRELPSCLKSGPLTVTAHRNWDDDRIAEWWPDRVKWYQSFRWGPTRADTELLWMKISREVGFQKKKVLDIGCNTGWFALEASRLGAIVDAVDTDKKVLAVAKDIARHISMSDVSFSSSDDESKVYDVIFYLSVHHQEDPKYVYLEKKLESLKARCRDLFVELINPPLSGARNYEEIDNMVGGKILLKYKHVVRRDRVLYHVRGQR